MGMGEPLANLKAVTEAASLMIADSAFGLAWRRVTISTVGLLPALNELAKKIEVALAISLHAPNDSLRNELVPVNRKYPIGELLASADRYVATTRCDHYIVEYTLLGKVNDSSAQAKELASLLKGRPCKVNLIDFNNFPGSFYSPSLRGDEFAARLAKLGLRVTRRRSRGQDIAAACGQLRGMLRAPKKAPRGALWQRLELPAPTLAPAPEKLSAPT